MQVLVEFVPFNVVAALKETSVYFTVRKLKAYFLVN